MSIPMYLFLLGLIQLLQAIIYCESICARRGPQTELEVLDEDNSEGVSIFLCPKMTISDPASRSHQMYQLI